MADKEILSQADETKTASYVILKFSARELPEAYRNLLFSKFLRNLRFGNDYFRLVDSDAYYKVYNAYFATLLDRRDAFVRLAVLNDDRDVVLGWSLCEPEKLHFIYVSKEQRRQGIGRALLPEKISTFTHITKTGLTLWQKKLPNAIFNPFA